MCECVYILYIYVLIGQMSTRRTHNPFLRNNKLLKNNISKRA